MKSLGAKLRARAFLGLAVALASVGTGSAQAAIQGLHDEVGSSRETQAKNFCPTTGCGDAAPTGVKSVSVTEEESEWIEGDTVRAIVKGLLDSQPSDLPPDVPRKSGAPAAAALPKEQILQLLDELDGLWLHRSPDLTRVEVLFYSAVELQFADPKTIGMGKLYGVSLPQRFEFEVRGNDGKIFLSKLDAITVLANVPLVTDKVRLRALRAAFPANLEHPVAEIRIDASAAWGVLPLVAFAHLDFEKMADAGKRFGLDVQETLFANLVQVFPYLVFFQQR